ncbi:hypothetical protein R1sor_019985 [Riccia sorocarpa]|uniref:DUF3444 domain-containing protein n=1 Tax=Riccia sorocarpa TaxID=122646 RepID=A0ABD3IE16_9MARC
MDMAQDEEKQVSSFIILWWQKVEAANIEVAENFRTPLPTALDDNKDKVHETLDDNSRVVLEVNCALCAELFIARKTKFNPQSHGNWVSRNHNMNSIIFKAEHSTTDKKPDAHSVEEQGPPSDVRMQRTNKGNKKIQIRTALKEQRYSAQSKRSSPKYHPTGQKATREERKRFTSNYPIKVSCCIGVELVDVPSADFYDLDLDHSESHIKAGQVWAINDDQDGMPRYYALIVKVGYSPFRVNLVWLDPTAATEKTRRSLYFTVIDSCCDTYSSHSPF